MSSDPDEHAEPRVERAGDDLLPEVGQRQHHGPAVVWVGAPLDAKGPPPKPIFKDPNRIPIKIQEFCRRIRARAADAPFDTSGMDCAVFRGPGNNLYSFRGFLMKSRENTPCHVMVLVEDAAERSPINWTKARKKFRLSEREIDVVNLLAQGLCNKEIGARLFVSEHTVKGHLKNITRKVSAESRGNIIAILK